MMKRRMILILLCLAMCILACGCGPNIRRSVSPFGYVWYIEGQYNAYAYMTELSVTESYSAPDGTEYLPEDGGELWIVKGKLHIDPWYILSEETHLRNDVFKGNIPLFCEPIIEENENGESAVTLLFCVKNTDYKSGMKTGLNGYLELEFWTERQDGDRLRNTFVLENFGGSPNPPYKPIV